MTNTGWMEDHAFEILFRKCFIHYMDKTNVDRPVLLVFDGHGSHIKYSIAQFANDMGMCLFCLPLHSSSKLEPLDVGQQNQCGGKS